MDDNDIHVKAMIAKMKPIDIAEFIVNHTSITMTENQIKAYSFLRGYGFTLLKLTEDLKEDKGLIYNWIFQVKQPKEHYTKTFMNNIEFAIKKARNDFGVALYPKSIIEGDNVFLLLIPIKAKL